MPPAGAETRHADSDAGCGGAVADLAEACARAAEGAFSANTERAIRSDLRIYAAWCAERGLRALPAGPETVTAFVDAMAETRKPATVRRYVASVAAAHRAAGSPGTPEGPAVSKRLKPDVCH